MIRELRRAVVFTLAMMVLMGGGYHVLLWTAGRAVFRDQAEGSLIRRADGTIVGSRLIAQKFTRDEYFHPRPSAVDYNAASTGGSNYGPNSPDQLSLVRERLATVTAREGVAPGQVPSELVTASGAGLDPDLSPEAAAVQAGRVARARGIDRARITSLIDAHTVGPAFGLFGKPRVNVLELNLALDGAFGVRRGL